MAGPSEHLSWNELACKDGTPYPVQWRATRAVALARAFEAVRELAGAPLTVVSAYRSPAHNRKVGGARASQHMEGRALDLRPPKGWSAAKFGKAIRELAAAQPGLIGGIGYYKTFIHIDVRHSNRVAVWWGAGMKDDRNG